VLRDMGLVKVSEPLTRLFNQGAILGPDGFRMSKSRGNVVNPDDYVSTLGADTVRCYLMFIGPWDAGGPWSTQGISGVHKFLNRVWTLATDDGRETKDEGRIEEADVELRRAVHRTIRDVTDDMEKFRFNTMLAKLMSLTNLMQDLRGKVSYDGWSEAVCSLIRLLAPSAPHIAEELWTNQLGRPYSVHQHSWPTWDEALVAEDELTVAVTVNGKPRGTVKVPVALRDDEGKVKELALDLPRVKALVDGQTVRKVIYVPGRILNLVVS
jgi:leucyl-tRNA synthetase